MSRKIVSPSIVAERYNKMISNNIWVCVDYLNKNLKHNPIRSDGSIEVIADFIVDSVLIEKVKQLYILEGWTDLIVTFTDPVNGYPGKTIVNFIP